MSTLTTIECSMPGDAYGLLPFSGRRYVVHLAGPTKHGTGPCICGFDRHARDEAGRHIVGFNVAGGVSRTGNSHLACDDCARLAGDAAIRGMHAGLFASPEPAGQEGE